MTQESAPGQLLVWDRGSFWETFGEPDEPRCRVVLTLFAAGHRSRSLDFEVARRGEPQHHTVDLEAGREEAALSGRIVGAERACVKLFFGHGSRWPLKPDEPTLRTVAVGVDGAFAFAGLPHADYRLEIESPCMAPRGLDLTAPVNGLLVELVASAALEVAVVDDIGVPQPGASVWVQSADEAHAWTAIADERGVARLEGLTNGRLFVEAFPGFKEGEEVGSVHALSPQDLVDFGDVTLAPGERRRIERTVRSHVAVTLRAELADGTRVGGLQLTWRYASSSAASLFGKDDDRLRCLVLTTDEAGEVRFEAFQGHHEFEARRGPQRFWCEARLRRDGPWRVTIVVPAYSGRGSIRGQLWELGSDVLITGRPIRAMVLRDDGSEGAAFSTFTDAAGAFVFTDLPAGPVRIVACSSELEGGDAAASRPYREVVRTVALASDCDLTVDLETAREGDPPAGIATNELDVEIVDDFTEQPLAAVEVSIFGIDADSEFDLATATSDRDGRVRLRIPASEHYRLHARPSVAADSSIDAPYVDQRVDVLPCDGVASATIRLRRAD